jgi:outer membrane protease
MNRCFPGLSGFDRLGRNSRFAKHGQSFLNGRPPSRGILAGYRVVDQRHTAHGGFHLNGGSCLFNLPSGTSCYHLRFSPKMAEINAESAP